MVVLLLGLWLLLGCDNSDNRNRLNSVVTSSLNNDINDKSDEKVDAMGHKIDNKIRDRRHLLSELSLKVETDRESDCLSDGSNRELPSYRSDGPNRELLATASTDSVRSSEPDKTGSEDKIHNTQYYYGRENYK